MINTLIQRLRGLKQARYFLYGASAGAMGLLWGWACPGQGQCAACGACTWALPKLIVGALALLTAVGPARRLWRLGAPAIRGGRLSNVVGSLGPALQHAARGWKPSGLEHKVPSGAHARAELAVQARIPSHEPTGLCPLCPAALAPGHLETIGLGIQSPLRGSCTSRACCASQDSITRACRALSSVPGGFPGPSRSGAQPGSPTVSVHMCQQEEQSCTG